MGGAASKIKAESKFAQIYKKYGLEGAFYVVLKALERDYVTQTKVQFTKVNEKVNYRERNDVQSIKSQSQIESVEKLSEIQQIVNESYKEKTNIIQKQFRQEIKKYLPNTKDQPCQRFKGIKDGGLKFLYEYDQAPENTKIQIEEECKKKGRFDSQYNQLKEFVTSDNIEKLNQFLRNTNFDNNFRNIPQEAKKLQESRRREAIQPLLPALKSKS